MAARGELPDAAISESDLKIMPLTNSMPEEGSVLMRRAHALLPTIKITDLRLEVDGWAGSSRYFTHIKTEESAKDKILLLTAILANGINLGISKMAEACPGTTACKLEWLASCISATKPMRRLSPSSSTITIDIPFRSTGAKARPHPRTASATVPADAGSSPGE